MAFDYFYGRESEQYSFYRIPKLLFTNARLKGLSTDAKLLYGILLDRVSLSVKNGWVDKKGRVYIIFTLEEIMEAMGCADQKATRLLVELEKKCGLIERKRQGLGKPTLIYVKNFVSADAESRFQTRENHDSGVVEFTNQDSPKSRGTNTDITNTDPNDTDPFFSSGTEGRERKDSSDYGYYQDYFMEQLAFAYLVQDYPYDRAVLEEMLELLVDTVCTKRKVVRIAGDDKPAEVVKGQLMKLDDSHIRFVLRCMKENTTKIRNMRQYLLAALYNAPMTIHNYYSSRVSHDMANGQVQI